MYLIESKSKHAREEDPGERIKEMLCELKELVDDILEEAEAMEDMGDDQEWPEPGREMGRQGGDSGREDYPMNRRGASGAYASMDSPRRMARDSRRSNRYDQRRIGF